MWERGTSTRPNPDVGDQERGTMLGKVDVLNWLWFPPNHRLFAPPFALYERY